MFSNPFYHNLTKKIIVSFGQVFSNIKIQRYNNTGVREQLIDVPISYGNREKWYQRLQEEATVEQRVLISLPRIGFELVDMKYDPARRLNKLTQFRACNPTTAGNFLSTYSPVPYTITFNAYILTKTQDDMFQIIEQIIPNFGPQYNLTINAIPELEIVQDIPITFEGISMSDSYEGPMENRREIIATLTFSAKVEYFGAIKNDNSSIILKTQVDITTPSRNSARRITTEAIGVPNNYTTIENFFDVFYGAPVEVFGQSSATAVSSAGVYAIANMQGASSANAVTTSRLAAPAFWISIYGDYGINIKDDYASQVQIDSQGDVIFIGANGNYGEPYLVKYDSSGNLLWQKAFIDTLDGNSYKTGDSIAIDSNDNIYASTSEDDGTERLVFYKIDSSGNLIWKSAFDNSINISDMGTTDIVVDSLGNSYACIVKRNSSNEFCSIIKLDTSGNLVWENTLESVYSTITQTYPQSIILDSENNIFVQSKSYTGGNNRVILAKFSNSGTLLWQKEYYTPLEVSTNQRMYPGQMTIDSSNNIYICNTSRNSQNNKLITVMKLTSGGEIIWQRNFDSGDGYGIALDESDNVYISGMAYIDSNTEDDIFVIKLDNNGVVQWQRALGGAAYDAQYYYWSVKTVDVKDDAFVTCGWGYSPNLNNSEAIIARLPINGSLTGTYGDYVYREIVFPYDSNQATVIDGTAILNSGNIGNLQSGTDAYAIINASNSNFIYKIANTYSTDQYFNNVSLLLHMEDY